MLEAVLFDGGDTLVGWAWDERLLGAGHDAGLRALGREPSPELTARFRAGYLPLLQGREELDEVDYPALMRRLLGEFGIEPSAEELDRFLAAEHEAWAPARRVGDGMLELLDALRARGLRLGLVSNSFDPGLARACATSPRGASPSGSTSSCSPPRWASASRTPSRSSGRSARSGWIRGRRSSSATRATTT